MSSTAISVENISKQYRLGQVGTGTLSDDLTRLWCRLRGKEDPFLKIGQTNDRTKKSDAPDPDKKSGLLSRLSPLATRNSPDLVWALKDINFEVKEGEVLGIIGRNGAGKSTLLKILARVTTPTTGEVKVKGRIASLLEVGTGFHPDLTGRENIYLNGAILGMRKHEITRQLDEIIDFFGCERYIDTPVKRYSSGMYVRLAFAVAAHLDPEILIVDEVLAVGDAEFQKKCLGKMKDVSLNEGRTVLFVSHNMDTVKQLCEKIILMHDGMISFAGHKTDAIKEYQNKLSKQSIPVISGTKEIALIDLQIKNSEGNQIYTFNTFDKVVFELHYASRARLDNASFAICFDGTNERRILSLWSSFQNKYFDVEKGTFKCIYEIEQIHLNPGVYNVVVYAETNGRVLERIDSHSHITVGYVEKYGLVKLPEALHGSYAENFSIRVIS